MKQLCVLTALLALALAEPTIYFQETFEDGKPVRSSEQEFRASPLEALFRIPVR